MTMRELKSPSEEVKSQSPFTSLSKKKSKYSIFRQTSFTFGAMSTRLENGEYTQQSAKIARLRRHVSEIWKWHKRKEEDKNLDSHDSYLEITQSDVSSNWPTLLSSETKTSENLTDRTLEPTMSIEGIQGSCSTPQASIRHSDPSSTDKNNVIDIVTELRCLGLDHSFQNIYSAAYRASQGPYYNLLSYTHYNYDERFPYKYGLKARKIGLEFDQFYCSKNSFEDYNDFANQSLFLRTFKYRLQQIRNQHPISKSSDI